MKRLSLLLPMLCAVGLAGSTQAQTDANSVFPAELVRFESYRNNPVFTGRGHGHWDASIRERGWVMRDGGLFHMWYTGYKSQGIKRPGYATSSDGFQWKRKSSSAPLLKGTWVEDMMVVKHEDTWFMFAEPHYETNEADDVVDPEDPAGKNGWRNLKGFPILLTSKDRVHWEKKWTLDIRTTKGSPVLTGAYGTPTVYVNGAKWYLFYERGDLGIWLATSDDLKVWTNVRDDPVIGRGPESYDSKLVAMNQIIKHKGRYYAYYHGLGDKKKWGGWTTNVAVSDDLIHWKKYSQNPIVSGEDTSSGIVVYDGTKYRLYTMHPDVRVHLPTTSN